MKDFQLNMRSTVIDESKNRRQTEISCTNDIPVAEALAILQNYIEATTKIIRDKIANEILNEKKVKRMDVKGLNEYIKKRMSTITYQELLP